MIKWRKVVNGKRLETGRMLDRRNEVPFKSTVGERVTQPFELFEILSRDSA